MLMSRSIIFQQPKVHLLLHAVAAETNTNNSKQRGSITHRSQIFFFIFIFFLHIKEKVVDVKIHPLIYTISQMHIEKFTTVCRDYQQSLKSHLNNQKIKIAAYETETLYLLG